MPTIWDLLGQLQSERQRARRIGGESNVERFESHARMPDAETTERVARLMLVTEAIWELLSERSGVTLADLADRLRRIDARDGRLDGKHGVPADQPRIHCARCGAVLPVGKMICQFCGTEMPEAKPDPLQV